MKTSPKTITEEEKEFSKRVHAFLAQKLRSGKWRDIRVAERQNILDNFTVGKDRDGGWQVLMSGQEQDIVFYKDIFPLEALRAPAIKIPRLGPQFSRSNGFIIPLGVLELKCPQGMGTDQLIKCSHIAGRIRALFPHCAYYFVLSTNKARRLHPETVLRQAKGFDRVFLEWEEDKETIWSDLQNHFVYLQRIGVIA